MKKILVPFSYLLHPLFIPVFGALVFLYCSQNYLEPFQKYLLLTQIILITILIPITLLYFLQAMGKVNSIMVSDTAQRKTPMLIQIFLMYLLLSKSIPHDTMPELFFFYFGGIISTIMAFILLFFRVKASIHALGMGSFTTFAIGLSIHENTNWIYGIALLILLTGMVMSSRLVMKAHQPAELWLGLVLGIFPQVALLRFWL